MWCAGYTLRGRLHAIRSGITAGPRVREPPMEKGMADLILATVPATLARSPAAAAAVCVSLPGLCPCVVEAAAPLNAWRVESGGEVHPHARVIIPRSERSCEAANPHRPNGIDLAGVTICRWWGWGACCTLRGQLNLYVVGAPHGPSCMQESRIWQQSLTRS